MNQTAHDMVAFITYVPSQRRSFTDFLKCTGGMKVLDGSLSGSLETVRTDKLGGNIDNAILSQTLAPGATVHIPAMSCNTVEGVQIVVYTDFDKTQTFGGARCPWGRRLEVTGEPVNVGSKTYVQWLLGF